MPSIHVPAPSREAPDRDAWLAAYREERLRKLERENEMLRGERERTEQLLALAMDTLSRETGISMQLLFDLFAALLGTELSRPAWVEQRERRQREAQHERMLRLLRETAT